MVNVKYYSRDFSEILLSVLFYVIGSIVIGLVLSGSTSLLRVFPAIIVIIPASNGIRGNIYAPLGSRLNTLLHLGLIEPSLKYSKYLAENIFSVIVLVIVANMYLSILGSLASLLIGYGFPILEFISVTFTTSLITLPILTLVTITISITTFRFGLDPDNFSTPLVTLVSDVVTLPTLLMVLSLVSSLSRVHLILISLATVIVACISILKLTLHRVKHEISIKIVRENLPPCLLSCIVQILPGMGLGIVLSRLLEYPSILFLIPPFIGSIGALIGIVSSKFSTALHLGEIEPKFRIEGKTLNLIITAFTTGFIIFSTLFIIDVIVSTVIHLEMPSIPLLFILITLAGFITLSISLILSYYTSVITFTKGVDPDNVVIPLLTSIIDLLGVIVLSILTILIV
ncbi:MAG TPA: hypothetical protein EYH40_03360 [Desulfurococcales archaeon]|nr:hypothetical protein [Desulfurococcales archaeon]